MFDAIIIGGGIVGMSAAYHAVLAGAKTLLIDRHDSGRATDAGAGILAPETNSRDGEAWFQFGIEAGTYYPHLIAQLTADNAGETGYARCGQLTVAVDEDEVPPLTEAKKVVFERQARRGTPEPAALHEVSSAEAQALFPALAETKGAIYYRDAARVDGRLLTAAMGQAAAQHGLMVKSLSAERLVIERDEVIGVEAGGETFRAGGVVIAGGAWSRDFGAQLGVQIPVEPQRGQIIHLDLPGVDTAGWPIINAFHGHYLVAWDDQRVAAGATREVDSGFEVKTTADGVREVLAEAIRVAPGLSKAGIREIRIGLRPATPDALPVLGSIPAVRRIYLATGHGPTGLQLGPYSGKLIVEMVLGNSIETDLSPFSVTRFQ